MLFPLGKRPGEPWECGRCCSLGSRAVLTRDRRPGCHVCKNVTSMTGIMSLIFHHCYTSPRILELYEVETPFKAMFERAPVISRPLFVIPVIS